MADPTIRVIDFRTEYTVKDGEKIARDMVKYSPISAMTTTATWRYINEIDPGKLRARPDGGTDTGEREMFMRALWEQVEPAYIAWKSNNEVPENGTPLSAWPGINNDMAQALIRFGFRTVESVAELNDAGLSRIPLPDMRRMVTQAKAFLEAQGNGQVAAQIADQATQIERLQEQMATLIAERDAAIELATEAERKAEEAGAADEPEDKPKRRGRPPKSANADEQQAAA